MLAHFLAMLFAAIGSAATVLTAAMPWLQPDTLSRRIKAETPVPSQLGVSAQAFETVRLSGGRTFSVRNLPQKLATVTRGKRPFSARVLGQINRD
jgi:hypothetical protein